MNNQLSWYVNANRVVNLLLFWAFAIFLFGNITLQSGLLLPELVSRIFTDPGSIITNVGAMAALLLPVVAAVIVFVRQVKLIKQGSFTVGKAMLKALAFALGGLLLGTVLVFSPIGFAALVGTVDLNPFMLVLHMLVAPLFVVASVYFWLGVAEYSKQRFASASPLTKSVGQLFTMAVLFGIFGFLGLYLVISAGLMSRKFDADRIILIIVCAGLALKSLLYTYLVTQKRKQV